MGMGDEIMAAGRAEAIYEDTGWPVAIMDRDGKPREHFIWHGNPAIDAASRMQIVDGPHCRPYVSWKAGRAVFNMEHRPRAGHVYLTGAERAFAYRADLPAEFAVIEPHVMAPSSPNKRWPFERWAQVAEELARYIDCLQLGPDDGRPVLPRVRRLVTPHARLAAAVIERAAMTLSSEGGTHHLAAASRRPAVVIFGSFTPPAVTGYPGHVNISVETKEGYCGTYVRECPHCTAAMATITPERVAGAARSILEFRRSLQRLAPAVI